MTIVLFLDSDWQPLRVEPWTRAITDLFLGKIEVIEYSRDRTIKGVAADSRCRPWFASCGGSGATGRRSGPRVSTSTRGTGSPASTAARSCSPKT